MEKPSADKLTDHFIKKILQRHAEFLRPTAEGDPRAILTREEYMEFSILLYSQTESEKDVKNSLGVLKTNIREYIQQQYLPLLDGRRSDSELAFIDGFNEVERNFRRLLAFIEKFFYHIDRKEIQKCYFLEGTARQIFETLFIEHVVMRYRHDLIKTIQRWFNEFGLSALSEAQTQQVRTFLVSLAQYVFADVFIKEKIANDIQTTILNVLDLKMKKFVAHVTPLDIHESIREAVAFKAALQHNLAAVLDQRAFFNNIRADAQALLGKTVLQHILLKLKHNDFREINAIIDGGRQPDLEGISLLFTESDEKIEDFKDFFINYISSKGGRILQSPLPKFKEVEAFIRFLIEMEDVIARFFQGNRVLRYSKNKALERTIEEAGAASLKAGRDFTRRFYGYLTALIEERLFDAKSFEMISDITSYLDPRAFVQHFAASFVRKIVNSNYFRADFGYEQAVLEVFVRKMGEECCQSIQSVLKDIQAFKQERQAAFEKFKQNLMLGASPAEFNLTVVSKKDLGDVTALRPLADFKFNESIAEGFFHSNPKNSNKKLEFDYAGGYCQFEVEFAAGVFVLEGAPIVLATLLYVAANPGCSTREVTERLVSASTFKEAELAQMFAAILAYLVGLQLVSTSNGAFDINKGFNGPEKVIRLEVPKEDERQEASEGASVQKERYFDIESKIMFLVKKSRRTADELRDMIEGRVEDFEIAAFRKSLNYLVQNDYIKRLPGQPDVYEYK